MKASVNGIQLKLKQLKNEVLLHYQRYDSSYSDGRCKNSVIKLNRNRFFNTVFQFITKQNIFGQIDPSGGGGGVGPGAPADCEDVVCKPCRTQTQEIFVPNECCRRCEGETYDCRNVRCYRPFDICEVGQVPIPEGFCCPQCLFVIRKSKMWFLF